MINISKNYLKRCTNIKNINKSIFNNNSSIVNNSTTRLINGILINSNNSKTQSYTTTGSTKPLAIGQPTHDSHPHLLKKDEIVKGIYKDEFQSRRNKLVQPFKVGSVIVLFSGPEPMMSNDIPWTFRQGTNFNYFTGFNEPESVLVLVKTSETSHDSHLFVRERIAAKEIWDGPRCGGENVERYFGIRGYNLLKDIHTLNNLLQSNHNNVFVNTHCWKELASRLPCYEKLNLFGIEETLQANRLVKSENEISTMLDSGKIAGDSFAETMKFTQVGQNEYQVSAYFEFQVKNRGAQRMSYPPVVAGGNNGHTLHYIANNQILKDGELLLMDAGCEYWGYTSDITRTFPINGKFTEEQKDIYNAVLDVNKQCIEMCKSGETINSIHLKSIELIKSHLERLGITNGSNPNDYRVYYPHSIGHYLGMDTHDTLDFDYSVKLEPGMIITIEPGIYISKYDTNVPEKYRGISIRVEDDVVIPSIGNPPLVLTYKAPKEIKDIELIMNNK